MVNLNNVKKAQRGAFFSWFFGQGIGTAREYVADFLIKLGVTPNMMTILGMLTTIAAGVFMAFGAGFKVGSSALPDHSYYGFIAGLLIIFASAFDILDGAIARNSGKISRRGAFLDSSCDRIADASLFIGIVIFFFRNPQIPRAQLFALAAMIAFANAEFISYTKARAENFIPKCPVGYWQRGERIAGIFIGLFSGHIATVMVLLAISSSFTTLRRITFSYQQIRRQENQQPLLDPRPPFAGFKKYALWYYPRMSLPYDIVTAANIAIILFVDLQRWT